VGLLLQPVQPLLALVVLRTIVRTVIVGLVGLLAQGCAQDGGLCCRGADTNAHVHASLLCSSHPMSLILGFHTHA
jgi:hypothetical protein